MHESKDKVGVPTNLQRLIFEGQQLEERRTLAEGNIKNDSFLLLILRLRGGMMIKVKTLTGKEIESDIEPTDTIRRVNVRLRPGLIRLLFAGKQMSDDRTVRDYGIEGGSVLHLVLALTGGGLQ
ncbi:hypothetical protein AAC387_Pa05g3461 [Persea americana]